MKYSQMNLRSGLMARVQRKLDETPLIETEDDNDICPLKVKKIKVRERQRGKQNMGWMLR